MNVFCVMCVGEAHTSCFINCIEIKQLEKKCWMWEALKYDILHIEHFNGSKCKVKIDRGKKKINLKKAATTAWLVILSLSYFLG